MAKVILLQGSPRKNGNTKQFSDCFSDELRQNGMEIQEVWLYDLNIKPCMACKGCQTNPTEMACVLEDDMIALYGKCLEADLIVFSTPIYAFFATAPVKAFMDRFIYASGKYYSGTRIPPLTQGKRCAVLSTAGYSDRYAVAMFTEAVRKMCRHIGMEYLGSASAQDFGADHVFMTAEKEETARAFARTILQTLPST